MDGKDKVLVDPFSRAYSVDVEETMARRKHTDEILLSSCSSIPITPEKITSEKIRCDYCGRSYTDNEHGCPGCGAPT